MYILARGNDAIKVNPITGVDESLTVHGSDWLWAVTAIYCFVLVSLQLTSF
jgi:bacteriorhodopsin